jgi:hypothetical protein
VACEKKQFISLLTSRCTRRAIVFAAGAQIQGAQCGRRHSLSISISLLRGAMHVFELPLPKVKALCEILDVDAT